MSAKMDVVARMQGLSDQAAAAGNTYAAETFKGAADLLARALERAAAQETMRDRFAMAALTGMVSQPGYDFARRAYRLADEMLEARRDPIA